MRTAAQWPPWQVSTCVWSTWMSWTPNGTFLRFVLSLCSRCCNVPANVNDMPENSSL